jgi:hypothetical protein
MIGCNRAANHHMTSNYDAEQPFPHSSAISSFPSALTSRTSIMQITSFREMKKTAA